jgi:hypothetical protein
MEYINSVYNALVYGVYKVSYPIIILSTNLFLSQHFELLCCLLGVQHIERQSERLPLQAWF